MSGHYCDMCVACWKLFALKALLALLVALPLSQASVEARVDAGGSLENFERLGTVRRHKHAGKDRRTQIANSEPESTVGVDLPHTHSSSWNLSSFLAGITVGIILSFTAQTFMIGCKERRLPSVPKIPEQQCHQDAGETGSSSITSQSEEQPVVQVSEVSNVESLHLFWPRCSWLATMLLVQSISSLLLAQFHHLIANHADLIFFLTMLVGLGGNAGAQSVVLTVRRMALGERASIAEQVQVGCLLSLVLGPLAFLRGFVGGCDVRVCITVGLAAAFLVTLATGVGTAVPKWLAHGQHDPGQAATAIQVMMDILGIAVVCSIGKVILR